MSDVSSNNVSDTVDVQFYAVDQDVTGEETKEEIEEETEEGTEDSEEESTEYFDVSGNDIEEITEPSEDFERVEGETVDNGEEYISETVDVSNDNLSYTTDYSNYFSFLIAVILGIGAVLCWAKGFTE